MEDYAIKFEHVSKIYKLKKKNDGKSKSSVTQRFYALNDITFTIPKGEVALGDELIERLKPLV